MKKLFEKYKKKLLWLSLLLVAGTTTYVGFQNNERRIFNVLNYGAKGDGVRLLDGGITATLHVFTSASASFTAADVGKCILIPNAGPSHADLPTTISGFTNGTTVTVTAAASFTVSADTVNYGTDNSVAFQAAYTADSAAGGGVVYVPNGVYLFNGALSNGNCIVHIPSPSLNTRVRYVMEGETPPYTDPMLRNSNGLSAHTGVCLLPISNGSGSAPALFGSVTNNDAYASFKNLQILLPRNQQAGGPTVGGINMYNILSGTCNNVIVSQDGAFTTIGQPTNEVAAFIFPQTGVDILIGATECLAEGFKYGFVIEDHFEGNNIAVNLCTFAYVFPLSAFPATGFHWATHWCPNVIYCPPSTILGYVPPGQAYINVGTMIWEPVTILGSPWTAPINFVNDSNSNLIGDVKYTTLNGYYNSFSKFGGKFVECIQLGANGNRTGTQGRVVDFPISDDSALSASITFHHAIGANTFTSLYFRSNLQNNFQLVVDNGAASSGTINTFSGRQFYIYDSANARNAILVDQNDKWYFGQQIAIDGAGTNKKIGIGNQSPPTALSIFATAVSSDGQIMLEDPVNSGVNTLLYSTYYGHNGTRVGVLGFGQYGGLADPNYYIANENTGDIVFRNSSANLVTIKNGGNALFGAASDNNAFIQAAANTTTNASIFLNSSSGTDVTSPTNGMLWYNGTNLYFKPSGTKVDLLAGGGGGFTNPMTTLGDMIVGGSGGSAVRFPVAAHAGMKITSISSGIGVAWEDTVAAGGGASLTATQIGYGNGSNVLTGDANLTYTTASGLVTLGDNQNAYTTFKATNTTAGTGAGTRLYLSSDGVPITEFGLNSSTTTGYGAMISAAGFIYSTATHFVIQEDVNGGVMDWAFGAAATRTYTMSASVFGPDVTNTNDLGTASLKWRTLYLSGTAFLGASTTGGAPFNMPSGTAPTSPNAGDLWNDGTNYVFKSVNLAPAVTVNNDLGTSSLAWRDIYFSHTVGESAIGVSSSLGTNVSSVTPAGNDEDFTITMVTSGAVSGTMAAIAFGRTWGAAPHCVISSADATTGSAVALSVGGYEALNATSASSMTFTAVITASGTYKWNCHCGN